MATPQDHFKRVAKLLESMDIAMFTTRGRDGHLVSRPLSTQSADFDGTLWFLTSADSSKVGEIQRDPHVNVGYASKEKNTYVSVAGTAQVLRDQAKIDALWSDFYKAFWPKGPRDPQLRLVRVDVATVEYWDGPGSLVGQAIRFVIARVTKDDSVLGENRTLRIDGQGRARVVTDGDPNDPPGTRVRTSRAKQASGSTGSARKATKRSASAPERVASKAGAKKGVAKKGVAKKAAARKAPARKRAKTTSAAKKASARKTTSRTTTTR